jgi:hypothetical protein
MFATARDKPPPQQTDRLAAFSGASAARRSTWVSPSVRLGVSVPRLPCRFRLGSSGPLSFACSTIGSAMRGGGIRTLGTPNGVQRFSRPRRNDRNAASQLEPTSRGNAGGNESQPAVWATPHRQCRRPEDVQLLARVPSRPAACACSEPNCAPPMGKPASGAQQAGLSVLVSCGANCASWKVPQAREKSSGLATAERLSDVLRPTVARRRSPVGHRCGGAAPADRAGPSSPRAVIPSFGKIR